MTDFGIPREERTLVLPYDSTLESLFRAAYNPKTSEIVVLQDHSKIAECKDSSFGCVVSVSDKPFSPPVLQHILRVLKPGGYVAIQSASGVDLTKSFVFAGFVEAASKACANHRTELICRRAPWASGASAPLNLRKKTAAPVTATAPSSTASNTDKATITGSSSKNKWSLAASDLADDGLVELEDEDVLLKKERVKLAPKVKAAASLDDCGTGVASSRKACKNCTCGRATMDDTPADKTALKAAPVSACGSCGLGDAFRCSTCPFLGQPAFQPNSSLVKLQL
jgi:SAM-dependent methyltransferase